MEYIYSLIEYIKGDTNTDIKYGKPEGYKNINTNTMGKCGNRL